MPTRQRIILVLLGLCAVFIISGCTTSSIDCNYNGMNTTDGKPIAHVNTSSVAITLFGEIPLGGNPNLKHTFSAFITEARRLNGNKVRVVNSSIIKGWWSLAPITWIFVPVVSKVSGDVYQ